MQVVSNEHCAVVNGPCILKTLGSNIAAGWVVARQVSLCRIPLYIHLRQPLHAPLVPRKHSVRRVPQQAVCTLPTVVLLARTPLAKPRALLASKESTMRTRVRINVLDVLRVNFHLPWVKASVLRAPLGGRTKNWKIHNAFRISQPVA